MTASVFIRIVMGGVAALLAVQGLVILGTTGGTGTVWRILPGVVVLGFVVPRNFWVRVAAGVVGFAGAAGLLWVIDQTVFDWFETGAPPQWERYVYQIVLFGLYLSVYVAWEVVERRSQARAA